MNNKNLTDSIRKRKEKRNTIPLSDSFPEKKKFLNTHTHKEEEEEVSRLPKWSIV